MNQKLNIPYIETNDETLSSDGIHQTRIPTILILTGQVGLANFIPWMKFSLVPFPPWSGCVSIYYRISS